jgi:hypothetical protein
MSIEHRRPVWIALADLFLDTDVTLFYPAIARTLAESPYSIEELRAILFDEVAPVLQGNLLSVAGEWAGFEEEWLIAEATRRIGKKPIIRLPFISGALKKNWEEVLVLIRTLRPKDP